MISPTVDRSFLKDLKNMDSRLSVKFNGEHFVIIYQRPYGEAVNIYRVKAEDNTFRQPNRQDLEYLRKGDLANGENMTLRLKRLAYASEQMRTEIRKRHRENIRDMTKDDKIYLSQKIGQLTNVSKSNSAFRRIPYKPGKNVVTPVCRGTGRTD